MFYVMHETDEGFYVSIHEEDEMPAIDHSAICPTIEEADAQFHKRIGFRVEWREPDAEADPDTRLIGRPAHEWTLHVREADTEQE